MLAVLPARGQAVLCLASILPAIMLSCATATSSRPQPVVEAADAVITPVCLDGWDFNLAEFEGGKLYLQPPFAEEEASRMLASIRFANRTVGTALNVGELDLMD